MSKAREAFSYALPLTVPICAGFLFLGMSYGLFATGRGLPFYLPMIMSATIFAGSMEFVTVALLLAPFDPLGAFLLTLLVNGRHIFYDLTMIEKFQGLGWKKIPLIFGMCDESFAINATTSLPSHLDKGWFYLHVTWLNYTYWIGGVILVALAGHYLDFLNLKGIEFVLTALFLVLYLDMMRQAKDKKPALIGIGVSLLALGIFGKNYFVIPAMLSMVVILLGLRAVKRKGAKTYEHV